MKNSSKFKILALRRSGQSSKLVRWFTTCTQAARGFTLVELLAVMMVFTIVGSIVSLILVTSLRTATKTDVLNTVRGNGNYAILQLARAIREAKSLRDPYPCIQVVPTPFPIQTSS